VSCRGRVVLSASSALSLLSMCFHVVTYCCLVFLYLRQQNFLSKFHVFPYFNLVVLGFLFAPKSRIVNNFQILI
jgi:hypothetical protein